ncbi:MAG: hypothetical protein FD188_3384, partial [Ignavibacteria bacterium]
KSCESFRVFLLANPFILRTDHRALASLFHSNIKNSNRIVKWIMRLQEYPFTIEYLSGKENIVADALSRIPWPSKAILSNNSDYDSCSDSCDELNVVCNENVFDLTLPTVPSAPILSVDQIIIEQQNDQDLSVIRNWLENQIKPNLELLEGQSEYFRAIIQYFDNLQIRENVLGIFDPETLVSFRILVPHSLVEQVIESIHDNLSHEGAKKVILRTSRSYFWPSLTKDIKLFVSTCPVCDRFKIQSKTPKSPLHPVRVGSRGEILAIDVVGGKETLPTTPRGNKYIFVMIDLFTRYVVAVSIPDQQAPTISDALINRFILIFGTPKKIISDQGANFESAIFANLCALWRIHKSRTTAYHPAANGACERVNRTIKRGLQKTLNQENLENWDMALPHVIFAYNTSVHSTTGFTPFFLMFGTEARIPAEIIVGTPKLENSPSAYAQTHCKTLDKAFENVRETLKMSQKRMKDQYDIGAYSRIFKPGDQVRIRLKNLAFKPASKLRSPWSDLFEIISVKGVVITIRNPLTNETLNVNADRLSNVTPRLRYERRPVQSNGPTLSTSNSTNSNLPNTNRPVTDSNTLINNSDSDSFFSDTELLSQVPMHDRKTGKRHIKSTQKSEYIYAFPMKCSTVEMEPSRRESSTDHSI